MRRVRMLVHASAEGGGSVLACLREQQGSSTGVLVEEVLDVVYESRYNQEWTLSGFSLDFERIRRQFEGEESFGTCCSQLSQLMTGRSSAWTGHWIVSWTFRSILSVIASSAFLISF